MALTPDWVGRGRPTYLISRLLHLHKGSAAAAAAMAGM